jgi:hypothetical protein
MGNCCDKQEQKQQHDHDEKESLVSRYDINDIFEQSGLIHLIRHYLKQKGSDIVHIGIYFADGNIQMKEVIEPLINYIKILESDGQHVIISDKTHGSNDKYFLFPINTQQKKNSSNRRKRSSSKSRRNDIKPFFFFIKITNFYIPYQYGRQILYQTYSKKYYREEICVICEDRESNVLYKGCGHLRICLSCQSNLKDPAYSKECQGRVKCAICDSHTGIKGKDWIVLSKEELKNYRI